MIEATDIQKTTIVVILHKLADAGLFLANVRTDFDDEFEEYKKANMNLITAIDILEQIFKNGWLEHEDLK
jgi:hypothetical protein